MGDNEENPPQKAAGKDLHIRKLPGELRIEIYKIIVSDDLSTSDFGLPTPLRHPFLEVCKWIRADAGPTFHDGLNIFDAKLREIVEALVWQKSSLYTGSRGGKLRDRPAETHMRSSEILTTFAE